MRNKLAEVLTPYKKVIDSSAMRSSWTKCSLTSSNLQGTEVLAICEHSRFYYTKPLYFMYPHSIYGKVSADLDACVRKGSNDSAYILHT